MWMLPSSVKIYVASEPTDLRRGFDGLAAATRSVIGQSPLSGHLFVFVNRRRNRGEDFVMGSDGLRIAVQETRAREL